MITKEMKGLCIKAVTGNIDKIGEEKLKSWLAESDENRREYESIHNIWTNSAFSEVAQIPDVEKEWFYLKERIDMTGHAAVYKDSFLSKISSKLKPVFSPSWKPALGFTMIIIFILALFLFNRESPNPKFITTLTENKEHKSVQLADGTTVLLNYNSSLIYPQEFYSNERKVTLYGEAFFSVTKDTRPFIIMTANAKTTVLGTKFDVWARGEKTRVIVKEGRVNLASKQKDAGVILTRDELSTIVRNEKPTVPKPVHASYLLGWLNNKLVFDKTPLSDVVDELERFYDIKLFMASENLKTYTLSGSFKNNDADSALTMICLALDLKYEKQNGTYILEAKLNKR